LYIGSRYLFALAQNRQAPRFLLKCTKKGVPVWCVLVTWAIGFLTYLSCSSGSTVVFGWFQNLVSICTLFTWIPICITYIRFHAALKAQGVDRNTLVYKSPFQPYMSWVALGFFVLVLIFNGFDSIAGGWDTNAFITDYINFPIFLVLYLGWKIVKRTKFVKPAEADIYSGKAALDAVDWPERLPKNMLEKIWFWIA